MIIILFYKNLKLGFLNKTNNLYHFSLNEEDYDTFKKEYLASKTCNLKNCSTDTLFYPFDKILDSLKNRTDLLKKIKETKSSDDFAILCKSACLKQNNFGYHLKLIK